MRVTVSGKVTKKLSKQLVEASKFFADLLMDPRMVKNIILNLKLIKNLDSCGYCEVASNGKPYRKFVLEILADSKEDPLETLAHEMVHVKQYAKNELSDDLTLASRFANVPNAEHLYTRWKGELWKPKGKEDPYFDSPWEIEAFGRGSGLYIRWQILKKLEEKAKKAKAKNVRKSRKSRKTKARTKRKS